MNWPEVKGHCPACGPNRTADAVAEYKETKGDEVYRAYCHRILRCRGCEDVYFSTESWFSEDLDYKQNPYTGKHEPYIPTTNTFFPKQPKREHPVWHDVLETSAPNLASLMDDVYGTLNADLAVPSAVAMRTAFDSASETLGVDPAITFQEKLDALQTMGRVGSAEKQILIALTDAGNAAAHRGWRPSPAQLQTMIEILEGFLHRIFVLEGAAGALQGSVPPKPRRGQAPIS
jgi:hypothetical protein